MKWTPRTVKDQSVQYPNRYQLKDISTGEVIATYDIEKMSAAGDVAGTEINAAYLQPIEDFLGQIQGDLNALGVEIAAVQTSANSSFAAANTEIASTESRLNASISAANTKITTTESGLNTSISAANTKIATTESGLNASISTASAKITSTEKDLNTSITTVNGRITTANTRMDSINKTIGTLAPKANASLTNPKANTVAVTGNNTSLATTAAVVAYVSAAERAWNK